MTTSISKLKSAYEKWDELEPNFFKGLTIRKVLELPEPILADVARKDYDFAYDMIAKITKQFIKANLDQDNAGGIALQFSSDIIEGEPTWKLADVIMFFKFIRQRQDIPELKIYGKLTALRLMELKAVYEDHRAIEREDQYNKKKSEWKDPRQRSGLSGPGITEQMSREYERVTARGKVYPKGKSDETFFENDKKSTGKKT